jgi:hypothetical protein
MYLIAQSGPHLFMYSETRIGTRFFGKKLADSEGLWNPFLSSRFGDFRFLDLIEIYGKPLADSQLSLT